MDIADLERGKEMRPSFSHCASVAKNLTRARGSISILPLDVVSEKRASVNRALHLHRID
jgi:hypothetical protein